MSSGEWDLRALKALEEEEQKEFLALSQKSLFEPPSPPAASKLLQQTQQLQQQPKLTYAQLHPHILKLPTINECSLIAAAKRRQQQQQQQQQHGTGSGGRLKFTRVLSLSAHSLTARAGGGGKQKATSKYGKFAPSAKSSGSLSPPQAHSVSPVYTPPPIRRCATLHHTQPVRKTFKTLQQLDKQKQERKREAAAAAATATATASARERKSPQLQRVAGTNKTYWKYGANSTAASIIGQRKKLANAAELESNTSDELGSEENSNNNCNNNNNTNYGNSTQQPYAAIDYDDSATETGSCSVPLAADSIEMMRLMLTAATTAVTTQPTIGSDYAADLDYLLQPARDVAATGGAKATTAQTTTTTATATNNNNNNANSNSPSTFFTLARYPFKATTTAPLDAAVAAADKTVAYEAFHALARRKSFSGRAPATASTLLRGSSLGEETTAPPTVAVVNRATTAARKMLKAHSVDAAGELDFAAVAAASMGANGPNAAQRSTIITNPIVEGIKSAATTTKTSSIKAHHMCGQATTGAAIKTTATTAGNLLSSALAGLHLNDAAARNEQQQQYEQQQQHQPHHMAAMLCQEIVSNNSSCNSPAPRPLHAQLIDDELEQHIKHCSCSCNHMGYGNSMDYQTTGFGGLPDVTEHSNIRRTLSRQNSISNSDSGGEIASIQKSKVNFGDTKSPPASTTASAKRKSKAAQQAVNVTAQRYKTRRGSCVVVLTLVAALCLLAIAATLAYQHFFMAPSRNSHAQRLKIVRRILREVPLVDGHNNFAWNVRKYAHSSLELVHLSRDLDHKSMWTRPAWAQTDMERLQQGLVGVQVWSAYVPCEAQGLDAVQLALEQIDIIRRLADMYAQETTLVTSSKDIAAARRRGQMASLIGIEGGHAIGSSLGVLRSFYSLGARYLSLTHKCDVSWAGSSASPLENGLTPFGKAIVREMNRLGMMIDLSYSSDVTARDVLLVTRAPVIFSHSAARQLCNATRNIPDDILRLVAENGGLIMISFDSEDVACGRQARLADVVAHIKHIRTIAGVQHIGLGAGYDSIELPPIGLEDVSKYPDLLATLLEDHNWSEEDVAMLAGKNFLRIMETVENVRDYWKRAAIQPIEQTEPQPKSQCTYMSS